MEPTRIVKWHPSTAHIPPPALARFLVISQTLSHLVPSLRYTPPPLPVIPVKGGIEEKVHLKYKGTFRFLFTDGASSAIRKKLKLPENISAPVKKNQSAGELVYYSGNRKLGSLPVTFSKSVKKATCQDCILRIWRVFLGNTQASF